MLKLTVISLFILLFMLVHLCVYFLLSMMLHTSAKRARLRYIKQKTVRTYKGLLDKHPIYRHLQDLLLAIDSRISVLAFTYASLMASLFGIVAGSLLFISFKGAVMMGSMGLLLPYAWLRLRLMNQQMQIRMDFLPAVEVFYQYYLLNPGQNIRRVLQQAVEGERIQEPIRSMFDQLQRNLDAGRGLDEALKIFNLSLGHRWSQFFAHIFRIGFTEGVDVSSNLKDLISDMRESIRSNQQERNRLLEIRLANFTPIFFLILFIAVNYKLNPTQTYEYYLLHPDGRSMLLDAVFLIFLSFIMGIYLSMKRI